MKAYSDPNWVRYTTIQFASRNFILPSFTIGTFRSENPYPPLALHPHDVA